MKLRVILLLCSLLVLGSCYPEFHYKPRVETGRIVDISGDTLICSANIEYTGNASIITSGFCWSKHSNPSLLDSVTADGGTNGEYECVILGLDVGEIYYFKAYATNYVGTAYGSVIHAKTYETGKVSDIDGNIYKTVKIGSQWWMAENLRVTHYNNGDVINRFVYGRAGTDTPSIMYLHDDDSDADIYGAFYNWFAISDERGLAPEGWHVSSDEEWKELEIYIGMDSSAVDTTGWRGLDTGSKIKSNYDWGYIYGYSNEYNGTDIYGLNILPAGSAGTNRGFAQIWTSTLYNNNDYSAYVRSFSTSKTEIGRGHLMTSYGYSARCVKDVE